MSVLGAFFLDRKLLGLHLWRWLVFVIFLPLVLLVFFNGFFSTRFGTGFLEERAERYLGFPCAITSVTWSPWAGVRMSGFRMSGLDGGDGVVGDLIRVDECALDFSWRSLFQGELRFQRLEVSGVRGELSLEQLGDFLRRHQQNYPPRVVELDKKEKPKTRTGVGIGAQPKQAVFERGEEPLSVSEGVESVDDDEDAGELAVSVPVDDFEGMIVFEEVNLRLYSEEYPEFDLSVRDCAGMIPLWGGSREGGVKLGSISFGKYLAEIESELPVRWDGSGVVVDQNQLKVFGVDFEFAGELRLSRGLPLGFRVNLPGQQMDLSPIFPDRQTPLSVKHVGSRNFLQGYLTRFTSFSVRSVSWFTDLVFRDPRDGGEVHFDRGGVLMTVNSAGLVVSDFRMIGEEDSLLGNGYATSAGELAGVLRLVASPVRADSHEKRLRGVSPELSFKFSPFVTPDREYRDIRMESRSEGLVVDLGMSQEWVDLVPVARGVFAGGQLSKFPLK